MNAKQALKASSKIIEEQEVQLSEQARLRDLYKEDVKNLYACIEGNVDGKSICDWCESYEECQHQDTGGQGCKEWEHILQQQEEGKNES